MADDNAVELIKRSDKRFSARDPLNDLRHEIALNFAPELAEWTSPLTLGFDFASHLSDGTPLLLARDYVGMIGSMLRPAGKQWYWHRTADEEVNQDQECRSYLDWRSSQMNRIVFDRRTGADGALTAADQFYGIFGDAVLSLDYADAARKRLMVQNHHTKDCVWTVGPENKPDTVSRKEHPPARNIKSRFSQKGLDQPLNHRIEEACEKDGDTIFEIRHEVLPAKEYDGYVKRSNMQSRDGWASVWVDVTNRQILRETYHPTMRYVIPRAGARHGMPYGFSRASMYALPDARMLQQQALAIIEAAEKQLSPPLIATRDAIRGTPRLDGITWVERDYDERGGDPLRALELGKNFRLGVEALLRTEQQLVRAFYLDRLRMPDSRGTKTREQAIFEIEEFVRSAVPMFSPMKVEYSDAFLAEADALIDLAGGYSNGPEMPEALRDTEFVYQWDNPLTDMIERAKVARIAEGAQIVQTIAGIEAAATQSPAAQNVDSVKMLRHGFLALGAPDWLITERAAAKAAAAQSEANQMREAVAAAPNIAQVIKSGAEAAEIAQGIPNPASPGFPMLPAPM